MGAMGRGESALADPARNEREARWLRADPILFRRDPWESDCWAGFQPAKCRRDACTTTGPNHLRLARLVSWREGRLRGPSLPGRVPSRPWRSSENDPNQVVGWVERSETHADRAMTLALSPCRAIVISSYPHNYVHGRSFSRTAVAHRRPKCSRFRRSGEKRMRNGTHPLFLSFFFPATPDLSYPVGCSASY